MKEEGKYYIEVPKNDFLLSEILKFFDGYINISRITGLAYSTVHHAFHYKGISNLVALKIDQHSNGKFRATEILNIKFSKDGNLKYLKNL